ncbi:MAG: helix-turn-helix domain-containing protein [Sedimentisphaerales bacterium]|jgi:predicted DNA-binding transcriptional regulator AlpA
MAAEQQTIEPLLIEISAAASLLGISRATFYAWLSAGKIGPVGIRLGDGNHAKPLFSLVELRAWVSAGCPSREQWQAMKEYQK